MAGGSRRTENHLVPYNLFTDPPLVRVGPVEGKAPRQGYSARRQIANSDVLPTARPRFPESSGEREFDRMLRFSMIDSEAGVVVAITLDEMLVV